MPSRIFTASSCPNRSGGDQALEEVATEPVGFLDGEHVTGPHVLQRGLQAGAVGDLELAADLLFEHLHTDRVEVVVLALGLLLPGADPHEPDERHPNAALRLNTMSRRADAHPGPGERSFAEHWYGLSSSRS
jgi:hypothetical protein